MSIESSFDPHSPALIEPSEQIKPVEGFPETFIMVFSSKMCDAVLAVMPHEVIGVVTAGYDFTFYRVTYENHSFGFCHTAQGGPVAGSIMEKLIAMGAKKFLYFGSCGSLDAAITSGVLIIPTHAYRDEGMSYHYLPASDWVEVPTADRLAVIFDALEVPYVMGRTWTTDACFRETRDNVTRRRKAGCICVEMECASVMAVGQFRNVETYQFLWSADSLAGVKWDERTLRNLPADQRGVMIRTAFETALRI